MYATYTYLNWERDKLGKRINDLSLDNFLSWLAKTIGSSPDKLKSNYFGVSTSDKLVDNNAQDI
eukprot:Pgem_evm1s217